MDRKEIKEEAKKKIKGNKWNILWPVLLIGVVEFVIEKILNVTPKFDYTNLEAISNYEISTTSEIILFVLAFIIGVIMVGYKKYILNFIRTGNFDSKEILNCVKEKWLNIVVATVLVGIIVYVCTLLLIIPGIIMALAYGMVTYIIIDTDLSGVDSLKKSREMMKGYKWNYFVFGLSFIGWILLTPFTFGILLIWLYPYMTVADALYYEKLKGISK